MSTSQAASPDSSPTTQRSNARSSHDLSEEDRKLRRLQMMMNMVLAVLSQDPNLTVERASALVADSRRAALAMFPGKELAFNLLWKPRLQRVMAERFHIQ